MRFSTMAVFLLLTSPVVAQIGNPGNLVPGTESSPGTPAPHRPNQTDRLFSILAAGGGMAEVDFGKLAKPKASEPIKAFGQRMIDDHSKANARLADLAKAAGIRLPGGLDADHVAARARLGKLSGSAFDLAYLRGQVLDHIKTVQLLEWEIDSGEDADIQHFASETLPIVLEHLQMAQALLLQIKERQLSSAQ